MANDLPDVMQAEPETMTGDPFAPDAQAPYGYVIDPTTQERRPRLRPGRRRKGATDAMPVNSTPPIDQLRDAGTVDGGKDRPPGAPTRKTGPRPKGAKPEPVDVAPFRAGPIAKGVNRLYRRAGRIVRVIDPAVGQAIIASTRKDPDDEEDDTTTVGEAWEEIARTNPRIRALLLRIVAKGAWGQLVAAHLPILLAILLKESILRWIPFHRLIQAMLVDDDDDQADGVPSDLSVMLGGINPADVQQMMAQFGAMAGMFVPPAPTGGNPVRSPVVVRTEYLTDDEGQAAA